MFFISKIEDFFFLSIPKDKFLKIKNTNYYQTQSKFSLFQSPSYITCWLKL